MAAEALNDKLKQLMPSSKKKKKGTGQPLEDLQTFLVNPIRGAVKQLAVHFQEDLTVKTHSLEELQQDICKAQELFNISSPLQELISKKAVEIVKEERLQRERVREAAALVGKRFKELSSSGVFA